MLEFFYGVWSWALWGSPGLSWALLELLLGFLSSPGLSGPPWGLFWALLGSPGLSWALPGLLLGFLGSPGPSGALLGLLLGSPGLSWGSPGALLGSPPGPPEFWVLRQRILID